MVKEVHLLLMGASDRTRDTKCKLISMVISRAMCLERSIFPVPAVAQDLTFQVKEGMVAINMVDTDMDMAITKAPVHSLRVTVVEAEEVECLDFRTSQA